MMFNSELFLWMLGLCLVSSAAGSICYLQQGPDPDSEGQLRWMLSAHDPCHCTQILPGGVTVMPHGEQLQSVTHFTALDSPIFTVYADEIQDVFICADRVKEHSDVEMRVVSTVHVLLFCSPCSCWDSICTFSMWHKKYLLKG